MSIPEEYHKVVEEYEKNISDKISKELFAEGITNEIFKMMDDSKLNKRLQISFQRIGIDLQHIHKWIIQLVSMIDIIKDKMINESGNDVLFNDDNLKNALVKRIQNGSHGQDLGLKICKHIENDIASQSVDCEKRIEYCKSVCCRLYYVPLTVEEIKKGFIQWDMDNPFIVSKDSQGICMYHNKNNGLCEIYDNRPFACRIYTCKNVSKIWKDFDNYEISELIKNHTGVCEYGK